MGLWESDLEGVFMIVNCRLVITTGVRFKLDEVKPGKKAQHGKKAIFRLKIVPI